MTGRAAEQRRMQNGGWSGAEVADFSLAAPLLDPGGPKILLAWLYSAKFDTSRLRHTVRCAEPVKSGTELDGRAPDREAR